MRYSGVMITSQCGISISVEIKDFIHNTELNDKSINVEVQNGKRDGKEIFSWGDNKENEPW